MVDRLTTQIMEFIDNFTQAYHNLYSIFLPDAKPHAPDIEQQINVVLSTLGGADHFFSTWLAISLPNDVIAQKILWVKEQVTPLEQCRATFLSDEADQFTIQDWIDVMTDNYQRFTEIN